MLFRSKPNLAVKLFWPNQGDRGVHVNLSGIGLTKHAPHPEAAKALVEWMTTPEAQKIFADVNQEFPAAVCPLEQADVILVGAGEGATLVTEKLGLKQGVGQRRAVLHDKRVGRSRAGIVNAASQQFLAGARLTQQQHWKVVAGNARGHFTERIQRSANGAHNA